jgi:hypothetical protein
LTDDERDYLERKIDALRREVRRQADVLDTWNTPLWKRCFFVLKGYRFRHLGRWYKAPWNADGTKYD